MPQDWNDNVYASGDQIAVNMQDIEDNFAALKSMFSGTSAPANTVAGMTWFDTTYKMPKMRNNADNAWLGIMQGDATFKIWVYRNAAIDGWVVDATVTDKVLALKGGSGLYNVSGAGTAGSWTQPDCTLSEANLPAHTHGSAGAHTHTFEGSGSGSGSVTAITYQTTLETKVSAVSGLINAGGGHTHTSVGSGTAHNHGTAYRPYAAVGTLQYPNV
jgi:hypothetical protein